MHWLANAWNPMWSISFFLVDLKRAAVVVFVYIQVNNILYIYIYIINHTSRY